MSTISRASAHGRFQPLHNEHMEYLLKAKGLCDHLYIGITQYVVGDLNELTAESHRAKPEANPLTFFERLTLVSEAMQDAGVALSEFRVIPFPIETPRLLAEFLPSDVLVYTTICEDWNKRKIVTLQNVGYRVEVLIVRDNKAIEGSAIRRLIVDGNESWKSLVPAATVRMIERQGIRDRLVNFAESEFNANDSG